MEEPKSPEDTSGAPAPEELHTQNSDAASTEAENESRSRARELLRKRHGTYRPTHKATFIGLAVIIGIIAINAAIIMFVLNSNTLNSSDATTTGGEKTVTLDASALDKLGVNRSAVGTSTETLLISPNTKFNGTITANRDVNIAGQLSLNGKLSVQEATLANLTASTVNLNTLNVNGDGTLSTLNLRKDLNVAGTTKLQGSVLISQQLSVNNSATVTGNLVVGGTLNARALQITNLTVGSTITIGGRILTAGTAPTLTPGNALGSNGGASISGNDAAGTVALNIGVGGGNGRLASIKFRNTYGAIPHVVITPIGDPITGFYITRDAYGFTIYNSGPIPAGGFAFDYIAIQ